MTGHPLDQLLEEMLPAATEVAVAVHGRDPEAVAATIGPLLDSIPDPGVRERVAALIVDLAALVPADDVPFAELLAWTFGPFVTPQQYAELLEFDPRPGGKSCVACQEWLPWGEFNRDRSRKDGRRARCRMCVSEARLERLKGAA